MESRYRPVPGGRQIARHFRRKIDAERRLSPSRITPSSAMPKQVLALTVMDCRLARNAAEHVSHRGRGRLSRGSSLMSRCMTTQRRAAVPAWRSQVLRRRPDPTAAAAARPCCAPMVVADTGRLVRLSTFCRMSVNAASWISG
jgi:hypothetical protein